MKWLLCLMLFATAHAADVQINTVIWRNKPLSITLVPGVEKALVFDEDVQWSIPKSLLGIVSGEASSGVVYLTSKESFEKRRFHVRGIDSNTYYLLDITASDDGDAQPLQIVDQARFSASAPRIAGEVKQPSGLIELARFAFQWLYAPGRLIAQPDDVLAVPLKNKRVLMRLVVGHDVQTKPVKQWRSAQGIYAVALELSNTGSLPITLDPQIMRSDPRWLSIAAVTHTLAPKNQHGDRTMVVVLSETPWQEASQWLH